MTNTYPVRMLLENSKPDAPSHRLSVIRWKATKEQPKARSALYVSVPTINLEVGPSVLRAAMQQAFEDLQDNYIRARIEADLEAAPTAQPKSFDASDLEADAVATWAAETAVSGKLSRDAITNWFETDLKASLEETFAALPNMDDDKLTKALAQYQEAITKLASPQASMPVKIAEQMSKAISLAPESKIKSQLGRKLEKFLNPAETSILELL
jgi:hypothetical protein